MLVGATALLTQNLLADDPRWAFLVPGAVLLGVVWFLVTNAFRSVLRARTLDAAAGRPRVLAVLVAEVAFSLVVLTALVSVTGAGTLLERVAAACVGTAAGFAVDALWVRRFVAADA